MARVESPLTHFSTPGAHFLPAFEFVANAEQVGLVVDATNHVSAPQIVNAFLELAFPPYTEWRAFGHFLRVGVPAQDHPIGYDPDDDGGVWALHDIVDGVPVSVLVAPFRLRARVVIGGPPWSGSIKVWAE